MLGMVIGIEGHILMIGKILGTKDNMECKIDSIAQSWSVISGAGENDKINMAMESLERYLVDKEARYY